MGSPPCEYGRGLYSEDQVQVTLTHDFEIQQTEMTQSTWLDLGFVNPSMALEAGTDYPDQEPYGDCLESHCPVGNLTIEEAMMGANVLSRRAGLPDCYALSGCAGAVGTGMSCTSIASTAASLYECRGYRLPTEAEWEYAARAGSGTAVFGGEILHATGCNADPVLEAIGWFCANSRSFSHPVGAKQANAWGLFDTSGNAFELTTSEYTGAGYGPSPQVDPMPGLAAQNFVFRGGAANAVSVLLRSASRALSVSAGEHGPLLGVRYVRTL